MSNLTADQKRTLSEKKIGTYFGKNDKEKSVELIFKLIYGSLIDERITGLSAEEIVLVAVGAVKQFADNENVKI